VDITGSQFAILCALAVHGELDQASVGRLTSLDRSSVAELAGRMARRGLIRKDRDEHDGRRRVLRITERGTRAVTEAAPHVLRLGQRLLAELDEGERERFLAYLSRVGDQADPRLGRYEAAACSSAAASSSGRVNIDSWLPGTMTGATLIRSANRLQPYSPGGKATSSADST
jgi:DNA-binding MarR family transcriptional regulator